MTNYTMIPLKVYGPIHKTIYKYEFLSPIVVTAALGAVSFGPIGLAVGALGGVDVAANHYKIYDKPYLTSTVLGWGMLSSFKIIPLIHSFNNIGIIVHVSDVLGAAIGLCTPMGWVYHHIDKIIVPVSGAISGYSYMGHYGAVLGVTLGAIDESLSLYNVTHTNPLTSILSNIATANLLLPQINRVINHLLIENRESIRSNIPALTNFIYESGMFFKFEKEVERTKLSALQLNEDLYALYGKIIPKHQLDNLIERQAISLIASQITLTKLSLIFLKYEQVFSEAFIHIMQTEASWVRCIDSLLVITKYILPYASSQIVMDEINKYFQNKFTYLISDRLNDELLSGEISLYLKQDENQNLTPGSKEFLDSRVLVELMNSDIEVIVANSLLPSAISTAIDGSYAIGHLYSINSLDTVLYSSLYNQLTGELTYFLCSKYDSYSTNITEIRSMIFNKDQHIQKNAVLMIINNANDFTRAARNALIDEEREMLAEQSQWSIVLDIWFTAKSIIDYYFIQIIVADKVYQGSISINSRSEASSMTIDYASMDSWNARNTIQMTILRQSIDRINELKDRMDEVNNSLKHQPIYLYKKSEQPGLCLNDFKIGKGNESKLYIEDLCIFNKHVAVTGVSDSGKSIFFEAIKQITHAGVWSEGNIIYHSKNGDNPYIIMLSQDTYIPPGDSLLELITFKKGVAVEPYRTRVMKLLRKIKIDSTAEEGDCLVGSLDIKRDWKETLSGEQKHKIDAIRLLLREDKPDIILLDEVFGGQENSLIHEITTLFNEEIPDTQIFIIDHEWQMHNSEGWYHAHLNFVNGTASLVGL
ncbi:MAG: hypothetical protein JKY53_13155 [Flavobacteriales bacterium]|nr:hypothetical protein [Flavobacteriales bacterium]